MDNINNVETNNDLKNLNFYEVLREIYKNNLSFSQFELYFTFFKKEIYNPEFYSTKGIQFCLALNEASVITSSLEEKEKVDLYKEELHNYVVYAICKHIRKNRKKYFKSLTLVLKFDNRKPISISDFIRYFEILRVAIVTETKENSEEINLLPLILKLQNAKVTEPASYTELFQFHDYQKLLAYYANELSKEDKMKKINKQYQNKRRSI